MIDLRNQTKSDHESLDSVHASFLPPLRPRKPNRRKRIVVGIAILVLVAITALIYHRMHPRIPTALIVTGPSIYAVDYAGSRYYEESAITSANVANLKPAWTIETGDTRAVPNYSGQFECSPIIIDGRLVVVTPTGELMALRFNQNVCKLK